MAIGYWPLAIGSFDRACVFTFIVKLPEAKSQKLETEKQENNGKLL